MEAPSGLTNTFLSRIYNKLNTFYIIFLDLGPGILIEILQNNVQIEALLLFYYLLFYYLFCNHHHY